MNLFIDTQIWLSFYHYSSEDLESLRKLGVLMDQKQVTLLVPEQVHEEFRRNREAKFQDAMKRFKDDKIGDQFPVLCKQFGDEYQKIIDAVAAYKDAKKKLAHQIEEHFRKEELHADKVIQELFGKAKVIPVTKEIVDKALIRYHKGNPPGKNDSLGDAINWECLLSFVPMWGPLHLVSDDKDYRSKVADHQIDPFLEWEWKHKVEGKLFFYRQLTSLFRDKFPDINLAEELEKEESIKEFVASNSFRATHVAIEKLNKFQHFSKDQVNQIMKAATTNSQIRGIHDDEDVEEFVDKIVENYRPWIDDESISLYQLLYISPKLQKLVDELGDKDQSPPIF